MSEVVACTVVGLICFVTGYQFRSARLGDTGRFETSRQQQIVLLVLLPFFIALGPIILSILGNEL